MYTNATFAKAISKPEVRERFQETVSARMKDFDHRLIDIDPYYLHYVAIGLGTLEYTAKLCELLEINLPALLS